MLKDMLKIPEKLQSLVSDYSMKLLQVRTSKPMQFRNPDVNTVFEASRFIYEKDYENLNAIYENKEIPSELGLVIGTITNSQSLIDRALEAEEKEGGQMIMCKALEELRMEGVLQGRTEGIRATVKTCKKFQINKEAIIETIGKEFSMSEKRGRRICRKILVTQKKTAGVTASSGSLSRMRSFPRRSASS